MNVKFINLIKSIGSRGICAEEELRQILPEFPILRGSEEIFKISHANAKKYIDDEVDLLIKGLHLVELKYIELTNNKFGFGSTSPTSKVINALEVKNELLARDLRAWVIENGGNYYESLSWV